jgi:hypothetical protein
MYEAMIRNGHGPEIVSETKPQNNNTKGQVRGKTASKSPRWNGTAIFAEVRQITDAADNLARFAGSW